VPQAEIVYASSEPVAVTDDPPEPTDPDALEAVVAVVRPAPLTSSSDCPGADLYGRALPFAVAVAVLRWFGTLVRQ